MSLPESFMRRVVAQGDGCWIWTGKRNRLGYGRLQIVGGGGREVMAHRVTYEATFGAVPDGTELDHLCRVTSCVNPMHLDPVTHEENVRRGIAGATNRARLLARTHCARGHEWTPENTKQTPRQRKCRACIRIDSAMARERRNAS